MVDRLEKHQGLIRSTGSWYSFKITPDGVIRAEESGIISKEKVEWHRKIRQHILAFLADLYEREGSHAHEHYGKIAEGAGVNSRIEVLRDLSLLSDIGDIKAASSSSYRITEPGLRSYRGSDYEDLI